MKWTLRLVLVFLPLLGFAQQRFPDIIKIKKAVSDTIRLDSTSINPSYFKVYDKKGFVVDSNSYYIDFVKSLLVFKNEIVLDSVQIEYLPYPDFLTRRYSLLSDTIIVPNTNAINRLYQLSQSNNSKQFTPFDGLNTSGSISRGFTVGNNQNSVLNSELDLQISGKLSDKVSLRASIQDANIPLQEIGYSQRLDEFDQIFIELVSDDWSIRAGDIDLINNTTKFANFTKRVQGLLVNADLGNEQTSANAFASGSLVRGQFTTSRFVGIEGNQGPYKLRGPNNQLFVLIVSGSETVYVNGIPLKRGETEDYIIDYNAGEIIFNSTFPITSEMRITVDYQFSDRNYTRFTIFGGGGVQKDKWQINAAVYSESDAKNQPLQQNLSPEQVEVLKLAGDNRDLMVAPSAVEDNFSENRILYRKLNVNGVDVFQYSSDSEETLYRVRFTRVEQGNYILQNANSIEPIYEYVSPVNGIPQGEFEPVVQLIAPEKLQIGVVNGSFKPNSKTEISFEGAGSKNDLNLFSSLDDANNDGFAANLNVSQTLIENDTIWKLSAVANIDFIQEKYRSVERIYAAEFGRDWNLINPTGDQTFITTSLDFQNYKIGYANYSFQSLEYRGFFNGIRHGLRLGFDTGRWRLFSNSSFLNSDGEISETKFLRTYNSAALDLGKKWVGARFSVEDNEEQLKETNQLSNLSQRFAAYEFFSGIGDSTAVYAEIGYKYRVNDSLRNNEVRKVNTSNTYYLRSKIIQSQQTNLSVFANYRQLTWEEEEFEDEYSLNSRILFSQNLFKQLVLLSTVYETNAGTVPRQDFTYVKVEPGQGAYTWNDYNGNGIQELDEFELAQFQDEGEFIRVLLPNQAYTKSHQNRFSQTITVNPTQWSVSENKMKKFWSHFFEQVSYLVDRKTRREGSNFDLNPFAAEDENTLQMNRSFRNLLFFNRGKQHYTTSYTYLNNSNKNLLSIGFQENNMESHQLTFNHKVQESWLFNLKSIFQNLENKSENFSSRNYSLDEIRLEPKLSYLFGDNASIDVFYQYTKKENTIGDNESLQQNNYGVSFTLNSTNKISLNGEFNYFDNTYEGQVNTPISYQILEGLQPGTNFTWSLIAQKKITQFLDLNLNYFGRKTPTSRTIHTGTIQLRAYF
ncbi:hypothetical protein [Aegicerativicinus sediminis]|uniref:hypothetical protein n=1 Tax=Aegicerativicinus sediminis TaxID=2893202 RepID=UPI001E6425D7|nr:hypothetical protein [Aegicerativicinus sediminis]